MPAGIGQTLRDTLVNMNRQHLGAGARTLFESLADAGLRTAAVNFTAYRGRTPHRSALPLLGDVMGPERFFFYNLFSWTAPARRSPGATGRLVRSTPMLRRSAGGS